MRKRMVHGLLLLLPVAIWVFGYRSTAEVIRQMELRRLLAKQRNLNCLAAYVEEHPDPRAIGQVQAFIGKQVINDLLKEVSRTEIPIPGLPDGVIALRELHVAFSEDFPEIKVRAEAVVGDLVVAMSVRAWLEIYISHGTRTDGPKANIPAEALGIIHIEEILPSARWHFLRTDYGGLVAKLLALNIEALFEKNLTFSIPLESKIELASSIRTERQTLRLEDRRIEGTLNIPGFGLKRTLITERVIFLKDGIHFFFNLESPASTESS